MSKFVKNAVNVIKHEQENYYTFVFFKLTKFAVDNGG